MEKHPDFPTWIKSEEGMKCTDYSTLTEKKYLINRLASAFDAGRNCVWDQFIDHKAKNADLITALKEAKYVLDWMMDKGAPFHASDHSDFFNLLANGLTVINNQLEKHSKAEK